MKSRTAILAPALEQRRADSRLVLVARGSWTIAGLSVAEGVLKGFAPSRETNAAIDLSEIQALDTAGAMLITQAARLLREAGASVEFTGADTARMQLLETVGKHACPCDIAPPHPMSLVRILDRVGRAMVFSVYQALALLDFLGRFLAALGRTLAHPGRLRLTSLVHNMEQVGLDAVPITALISFLIGVVLAFMGADQLSRFGAQIYVINLLEVSVLRELGVLLTAIVVAGRSGSAFTAQIGSMLVNEEVDAMRSMGLGPMEVLVLPRILALVFMLPALVFIANLVGLLGGGLMCWIALDIGPGVFLERFSSSVNLWNLWTGLIKTPFFALAIGLIGCFEGFQVSGSAESVGKHTTRSVVESIFLVIILDAAFAIFYTMVGI